MPQTFGPLLEMNAGRGIAIKPIVQVAAGNALEIYDFMIYGYYARYIAQSYFPRADEYASLMLALMTFAIGFLARPVGAIVLGAYTDQLGMAHSAAAWLRRDARHVLAFARAWRKRLCSRAKKPRPGLARFAAA
nr:hypothetical protein [uncultured Rhodopila sp.]